MRNGKEQYGVNMYYTMEDIHISKRTEEKALV